VNITTGGRLQDGWWVKVRRDLGVACLVRPTRPSGQCSAPVGSSSPRHATVTAVGVVEDVERVFGLVESNGTEKQRAWLERWRKQFNEAVDAEDEELCEDMHIGLVVFERTELRPPRRTFTLAEVAADLGFDPSEFA
jgi:hypothetical protein